MTGILRKGFVSLAGFATLATVAAPAEARHWRDRDDDDAAWAIGAGILGLGVVAALSSSSRNRYYDPYYGGGYYGGYAPGYYDRGYYGRGYNPGYYGGYGGYYGYRYRNRCYTRRVWDPYYGRRIRVRVCDRY
jgi:hypothetical protein